MRKTLKYLFQLLRKYKKYTVAVVIVMLINASLESVGISMILPVTQVVVYGRPEGRYAEMLLRCQDACNIKLFLPFISLLFLLAVFGKALVGLLNLYMSKKLALRFRYEWMNSVFNTFICADLPSIVSGKQGELLHTLINETRRGSICIAQFAKYITKALITLFLLIMILIYNPVLTLIIIAFASIAVAVMVVMKSYAKKTGIHQTALLSELTASAAESIAAIRQIKTLGLEECTMDNFKEISEDAYRIELKFETARGVPLKIIEFIMASVIISILLYVYFLTDVPLKSIIPALAFIGFAGLKILSNLASLSSLHWQIISLSPAMESLLKFNSDAFAKPEKQKKVPRISSLESDIVIRNLSFRYDKTHSPLLQDINITVAKNKITAITGPSGSGKSTLADLIMGFYFPDKGEIIINNHPLTQWDIASWREKIGYVSQDIYLFNTSVRQNIAIGIPDCPENAIIDAAKQADADKFISELPHGYETVTGDRGAKLSGGQKQKIAIARALIRDPELLIFDETTTALDKISEEQILATIKSLSKNKTVLIISHNKEILKYADNVYNLETR